MSNPSEFLKTIDKTKFTTGSYVTRVEKPWGYELHLAKDEPYMLKIMHLKAGTRQSLQIHDEKTETYLVINGRAGIMIEDENGELQHIELDPEKGYTTQVGQRHRLLGITDCDIVEASTPTRLPLIRPCSARRSSTHANTCSWTSSGSRARVRLSQE